MTKRELLLTAAALLAGFLGGAISDRVLPVYAQERQWPKVLTAEKLVAVDDTGAKRVEIGVDRHGQGSVKIYNEHGRLTWSIPETQLMPAKTEH